MNKAKNFSISSISRATLLAWFFIFTTAIPTAICHGEIEYMHKGDNHTACLFLEEDYNHSLFQVSRTCWNATPQSTLALSSNFCCWLITPTWINQRLLVSRIKFSQRVVKLAKTSCLQRKRDFFSTSALFVTMLKEEANEECRVATATTRTYEILWNQCNHHW